MHEAATPRVPVQFEIGEGAMKIALFCLEASRDDNGRLRLRFVLLSVVMTAMVASEMLPVVV
jgi:hypothetical protein